MKIFRAFNIEAVKPGDIILSTSRAFSSSLIRWRTDSDISHAMLCVARSSVIDSTSERVQARNLERMFYTPEDAMHVLRLKESSTKEQLRAVITFARAMIGTSYSKLDAVKATGNPISDPTKKQFCSRLVGQAFSSAGIQLVDRPDFCTPADLLRSALLTEVENCVVELTSDEAEELKQGDPTRLMRDATMSLGTALSKIDRRFETLPDALLALQRRPELDHPIADALKSSGYLDLASLDQRHHPWRYDGSMDLILQLTRETHDFLRIRAYCEDTLSDDSEEVFEHWRESLQTVTRGFEQQPSECLSLLTSLYQTLVYQHLQRIAVARTWLQIDNVRTAKQ